MRKVTLPAAFLAGLLSFFSVFVFGAAQVDAYCVYNDTGDYISEVHGEYCARCYSSSLSPHSRGCCPGNESGCRGKTWITISRPNDPWETSMHYLHFGERVTAHGWVRIKGAKRALSGEVYNDSGTLIWSGALIDGKKN